MGQVKRAAHGLLRRVGIQVRRITPPPDGVFIERAEPMIKRHYAQTREDVRALKEKYRSPVFGRVKVFELLERLALCIDPMDPRLGCVSQLTHALQVVEGMTADGITDRDLLVAALIHDLGKVLLLTDEDPANVGGMTRPIGVFEDGAGLDHCVLQWNHDEFGYSRFKDYVPDHVAWLIRYHSIHLEACKHLMDERDARYTRQYHSVLARYDDPTKSMFRQPQTRIEDYRDLIEETFPKPIPF